MAIPVIVAFLIINFFADITNKIYILKRNPFCFIVETFYHFGFVIVLIQQTILYSEKFFTLLITYILFIAIDRMLCYLFRTIFITGKYKNYERITSCQP